MKQFTRFATLAAALCAAVLVSAVTLVGCDNGAVDPPPTPTPTPTPTPYTLTYDGNGNGGGAVPATPTQYTSAVTVLGNTGSLTKSSKMFDGWNTNAAGTGTWYRAGDRITMTSDTTLYASWLGSDEKNFWAQKATDNSWYSLRAKIVGEGTHSIIYADVTISISMVTGAAIATEYDDNIYTPITTPFGTGEDVDGNSKVIFLLLDIIDGYSSGGYVAGYFDATHMFGTSVYAKSNEADMLFLDVYPATPGSPGFYATIAHELQHLINFSKHSSPQQEIWINEGLSSAAEYIYGGTQQDRIDLFNDDPYGTIAYGNNFFVWNGYWEGLGDQLSNYATAYLFFQWLRIQANGTAIYRDIIDSTYTNYRAVTTAAGNRIVDFVSEPSWGDLLSDWMVANARGDANGLYGYKTEISPAISVFHFGVTPVGKNAFANSFAPGEGIYSYLEGASLPSTAVTGSGSHIRYAGIPASGAPDRLASYTGAFLLTYNANTSTTGGYENGLVLDYQNSGGSSNMLLSMTGNTAPAPAYTPPASYPIGFHDKVAERELKDKPITRPAPRPKD